ncbi:unnamed protein product [Rotaria socialis]|nr:unnamed protein product [Rotaria socialis]CAF3443500.1 unnamed protein product [Rotaria socialis]CAF4235461.1 unnamed protein product [Rotaria socialis]CAF4351484.1 unnamed protein product [Rotaria socialis]CAF4464016.1 unnamed protein product [Rotaria socialis]
MGSAITFENTTNEIINISNLRYPPGTSDWSFPRVLTPRSSAADSLTTFAPYIEIVWSCPSLGIAQRQTIRNTAGNYWVLIQHGVNEVELRQR